MNIEKIEMKGKVKHKDLMFLFFIICITCLLFVECFPSKKTNQWGIVEKENQIRLRAGVLERTIQLADNGGEASLLKVNDVNVFSGSGSGDFCITLWKASPNQEPMGLEFSTEAGVEQQNSEKNLTDALDVNKKENNLSQNIEWIDSLTLSGNNMKNVFDKVNYTIREQETGVSQLEIKLSASDKTSWEGLSAVIVYQLYEGHPVIRKQLHILNNSKCWIKIGNLVIDDIAETNAYSTQTFLTPDSRGIAPCIVAYGDTAASKGLITVSEIPSKLRSFSKKGELAYNPDLFEWVIGPSEVFESEPVLVYAFSGESYPTVSVSSTALDRCVEGQFKQFVKENILKATKDIGSLVPVFCTWTNYAASIDEQNMREAADIASNIGFQCFQLDAGWSETGGNWGVSTPNPEVNKFPDLTGLMDYIRAKDMDAGLWYSIFISEEEGMNPSKGPVLASLPLVKRAGGVGLSMCYEKSREKYINELVYLNKTYHATYFKQDLSNLCYGDFAQGHESRTLKESYLRGLRGLFKIQDGIHEKAPDTWLQLSHEIYWETPGPAADIAVLKHADSYHASPNEYWGAGHRKQLVNDSWDFDPDDLQQMLLKGALRSRQLMYSHRGLPLERIEIFGAVTTNYKGSLSAKVIDRQICSWLMGAPNSFSGDLTSLTTENIKQYKSRFALIKSLQEKYGIYTCFQFSGVPEPTDEGWHWWGKLNKKGEGAVVVLRGSAGAKNKKINIPWVNEGGEYLLKALFSGNELGTFSGKQLQNGEFSLALDNMGQEIIELTIVK